MDRETNTEERIRAFLSRGNRHINVISVKETTSTNDEVKKIALSDERKTVLFTSESQSAGRGRKGRSFFSPEKTGIYMSLLFYPDLSPELCTLITPLCAVAVCEAIEKVTGIKADIKWVNDIYLGGKKVAGILTEGAFSPKGADYIIVGIGINLAAPEGGFPDGIREIAGSLDCDSPVIRDRLIAETVNCFTERFSGIRDKEFISAYRDRLFFLGKEITVLSSEGSCKAVAADVDDMCRLIVKTDSGERKILDSGEISVKI